jgi:hypothetical protein
MPVPQLAVANASALPGWLGVQLRSYRTLISLVTDSSGKTEEALSDDSNRQELTSNLANNGSGNPVSHVSVYCDTPNPWQRYVCHSSGGNCTTGTGRQPGPAPLHFEDDQLQHQCLQQLRIRRQWPVHVRSIGLRYVLERRQRAHHLLAPIGLFLGQPPAAIKGSR